MVMFVLLFIGPTQAEEILISVRSPEKLKVMSPQSFHASSTGTDREFLQVEL